MRRYTYAVFTFVLMGVLFWALVQINSDSPRTNVENIRPEDLPRDSLVLLEGGTIQPVPQGGEVRRFTLRWEGDGCLFVPKAAGNRLFVNGVEQDELKDDKLRLFQLPDTPGTDHTYEVELYSAGKILGGYSSCIYIGPLSAVSSCVSSQIVSRYLITGVSFCILIFSLMLYAWKRSETYLFWLALYAFLMLLRTQDALGIGWIVGTDSTLFRALDHFVISSAVFRLLYNALSSYLNYQVFRRYLSAKLFGRSIMIYILAADLFQLLGYLWLDDRPIVALSFYTVLFFCQIVCIQKDPDLPWLERHILSVAWVFNVVLQMFMILSANGVIPQGDVGLQFHIPPIVSCIYPIAFFLIACRRFAIKFQEADDLNAHLEAIIQEKTREQTVFIRSMLHNLKTPLFTLTGYTDMAAESLGSDPAEAGRYLAKVSDKAQYVSSTLDHLFLLTQMDARQVVFQRVPVRLDEVLRAVEESARLKGREKNAAVCLAAPQDAFCMGDPLYLQQAFQNIADNAVEHIGPGGRLDLALAGAEEGWRITFTDDGCGISAEELPKIFDRYYSNRRGRRSSSGLGLTIAREIVERHGGSITVCSRPERGTVFTIALPYPETAAEPGGAEKM